jgi:hypothetical protein
MLGGSVEPIVERVYSFGDAGGASRHLIEIGHLAKSS